MGNFRKGGFGRRDRGPVTMHQAICDQCGKPCEVPFRPTSGKPVYCNVCFGGKKGRRDIGKGSNDGLKNQLEILNEKIDRLIKTIEEKKIKKSIKKSSKK